MGLPTRAANGTKAGTRPSSRTATTSFPICDDDYFDDDITGRFVEFVRKVYGDDTLEENLKFVADALGGKGTPREVDPQLLPE